MMNQTEIEVTDIKVVDTSSTALDLLVTLSVLNPSPYTVTVGEVPLDVNYDGSLLGTIDFPGATAAPGENTLQLDCELTVAASRSMTEFLEDFITQAALQVTVQGSLSLTPVGVAMVLGMALDETVTMVGFGGLARTWITGLEFLNSTATTMGVRVNAILENPTEVSVSLSDISMDVFYDESTIGDFVTDDFDLVSGNNSVVAEGILDPADDAALQDLAECFLAGVDCDLEVNVTADSIVPGLSAALTLDVTVDTEMPSLDLNPQIVDFALVGATDTDLHVEANISITNPTEMDITLNSLNMSLFYGGYNVGNATIGNTLIEPGSNLVEADIYLTTAYHQASLEALLSEYISGNDATVGVEGEFSANLGGLASLTGVGFADTCTLEGLDEPLIDSVYVLSMGVTVPPFEFGWTATGRVNVSNPMPFAINITALYYDLYYNDNDGVTITFLSITYSYSAQDNIYLTTIDNDYSSTPIEIGASSFTFIDQAISGSDVDDAVRLYDEYTIDGDLICHARSGQMTISIGPFEVTLSFVITDIAVT
jgi:LEA14-like dessication related protein